MTSKIVVREWTRDGWIRRVVKEEEEIKKFDTLRSKISGSHDIEWNNTRGEMDLIQDVHNEIMYGPVGHHVDDLPNPLRDMFQQPYTWHIVNTRLFKIVDPETQLYENGDWGSDANESDSDIFDESVTTSRLFLEQANILPADASTEEVTDLLGSIADGHEVPESPYGTRLDLDISTVSIVPEASDSIIIDEEEGDYMEEMDYSFAEDEIIMRRPKDGECIPLPQLPEEVIKKVHAIRKEFIELLNKTTIPREQELIRFQYEQALDRAINQYLTCSLNSPYCGHKYSQPRRMHQFIATPKDSEISLAAQERSQFFYRLFGEATSCDSMNDLHGMLVFDDRPTIDGVSNPNYGKKHRPGGFMGKIRGMYQHDKELAQQWSIFDKTDKDGNIIQESAFNLARKEFVRNWRENQKGDEESLRIALWIWFDREAKDSSAVYDDKTGKLVSPGRRFKDSIWRQKRTKALMDLFLTRKQWDSIYAMVGISKKRIQLDREPTEDRTKVLEELAAYFCKITNLQDLQSYMTWAQKRLINKIGKVRPSKIDRISLLDESKWRQSCAKKRKHLMGRQVLYNQLREQVKSSKVTELTEQFLCCTDPKCNCMAIGIPTWYEIEENKGLLGVPCDGCGKIVWCLGHKDTPELKTYEEATNGY